MKITVEQVWNWWLSGWQRWFQMWQVSETKGIENSKELEERPKLRVVK